jgi:DNA-binding GntR family transcriptional regulator
MSFDTKSINEKIYELLREQIIFGNYAPGSRVDIKKLCDQYNVSPQPIKEAIFRLAGERFITIVPRKGTYVRQASLKDLVNMVESRLMYESGAIDLAVDRTTEKDIRQLEDLCKNFLQGKNVTYKEIQEKNLAFHRAVVSLAKNEWLDNAYGLLMDHYACLHYRYVVKGKDYSDLHQIYDDHCSVVEALRQEEIPSKGPWSHALLVIADLCTCYFSANQFL